MRGPRGPSPSGSACAPCHPVALRGGFLRGPRETLATRVAPAFVSCRTTTVASRVLDAPRVQRPRRLRPRPRLIRRRRRTIPTTHQRIRIVGRGLQAVAIRARRPRRTPLPSVTLLARGTWFPLSSGRTRITLHASRTSGTDRAWHATRTRTPVDSVLAILAVAPRRTRRTRSPPLAVDARWSRHPHPRLTLRTSHRLPTQIPHLLRQRPVVLPLQPQILRHADHHHGQPCQQRQRQHTRRRSKPLRPRQSKPTPSSRVHAAHFATTAHTAIAAESSPIRTGTIIW